MSENKVQGFLSIELIILYQGEPVDVLISQTKKIIKLKFYSTFVDFTDQDCCKNEIKKYKRNCKVVMYLSYNMLVVALTHTLIQPFYDLGSIFR